MCSKQRRILRDKVTLHDCLPSLLGDGEKWIEKENSEGGNIVLGRLEQPRQDKNHLYRPEEPNELPKEGPLSFGLFESPFPQFQQSEGPPLSRLSIPERFSDSVISVLCTVVQYVFCFTKNRIPKKLTSLLLCIIFHKRNSRRKRKPKLLTC